MALPRDYFNEHYYAHCCGRPYARDDVWLAFFGTIAEGIVRRIAPRRVLDAGCALGLLVEALRARGVEAYGFDVSEYAIAQVPAIVRPFCWQASVTDEIVGRYDLIVFQEILPHLTQTDAEAAVANVCRHTDDVLFSSGAYPPAPQHLNARGPEHWSDVFAGRGFHQDATFDATFVTPWAARYRRGRAPATDSRP